MKTENQGKRVWAFWIIPGLVLLIILSTAVIFYGYTNTLRSESISHETGLNAQYLSCQNFLSEYISGFYEMLGVSNLKSEKLEKILVEAVKGRYGEKGFSSDGALFSAIAEAYPDVQGLNAYDKIMDYTRAKREGYRAIQDKLLDMLRSYDAWRQDGWVQSRVVSNLIGIPSSRLEARIGSKVTRGAEARDQMFVIVLTEQATDAYSTGKMKPLSAK